MPDGAMYCMATLSGVLRCFADGMCVPAGNMCETDADCCFGTCTDGMCEALECIPAPCREGARRRNAKPIGSPAMRDRTRPFILLLCCSGLFAASCERSKAVVKGGEPAKPVVKGGEPATGLTPVVKGVEPATGPSTGGVPIKVIGTGFEAGAAITIDGVPADNVGWTSETQLVGLLPVRPGRAGKVEVRVVNPGGKQGASQAFTYHLGALAFGTSAAFPVAPNINYFATADFNQDGRPDVAFPGSDFKDGGGIYVLQNDGGGKFGPAVAVHTGGTGYSAATGDFNGDGRPDLIVDGTRPDDDPDEDILVLLGKGDGTFEVKVSTYSKTAVRFVSSLEPGDFNGDGKLDVATTIGHRNVVNVLLGDGAGKFDKDVRWTTTPVGGASLAAGDFNRDGRLDLVESIVPGGTSGQKLLVLLGNGDGRFEVKQEIDLLSRVLHVVPSDLNGDGLTDFVAALTDDNKIAVYFGAGDGTFPTVTSWSVGMQPTWVGLGDANADGRTDAVVTGQKGGATVLLGRAGGGFEPSPALSLPDTLGRPRLFDVDADGKADLVGFAGGQLKVLLNASQ